MRTVYVDSGFLIALYDETDEHHSSAKDYFVKYFDAIPNKLVVPWPIFFETISTRMAKNQKRISMLEKDLKKLKEQQRIEFLNDVDYREKALEECFKETQKSCNYRSLSLVDRVIRYMLSDVSLRIDYFITFNVKDFADVCKKFHRTVI